MVSPRSLDHNPDAVGRRSISHVNAVVEDLKFLEVGGVRRCVHADTDANTKPGNLVARESTVRDLNRKAVSRKVQGDVEKNG